MDVSFQIKTGCQELNSVKASIVKFQGGPFLCLQLVIEFLTSHIILTHHVVSLFHLGHMCHQENPGQSYFKVNY